MLKQKIKKYYSILKGDATHLVSDNIKIPKKWYGNDYGGFYVAPGLLNSDSIVYSFGIGEDISFDLTIITNHKCKVFGFDPTPKSVNWIEEKLPSYSDSFQFFDYGIAEKTGKVNFFLPKNSNHISGSIINQNNVSNEESIEVQMKSFSDIANELGHSKIDVLKMDIEGAEYLIMESLLQSEIIIAQILVEFHDRFFIDGRKKTIDTINILKKHGYKIFGVSDSLEEISFIKI